MKLLLLRFSSIGDIVLTTPVLRCLREQRPSDEIHYLTKPEYGEILSANPYIDWLHFLHQDLGAQLKSLEEEGFDQVIDLHHNARTLRIKSHLRIPAYSFPKLNVEKWLMVNFKWNLLNERSIVDRYFETVRHLGVANDGKGLDYFIPESDLVAEEEIPVSHRSGYIAMVIGAAHFTKRMPPERLQELCKKIDYPIVLLGGKEDESNGRFIAEPDPGRIFNACGKFRINGSADLVRRSQLVLTHDTGLMHIAAAFKKPVISLWGNTIPEFGMFPYYGTNTLSQRDSRLDMVENKHLNCRPCTKTGYARCPKGHFKCMKELDLDEIVSLVNARLGILKG